MDRGYVQSPEVRRSIRESELAQDSQQVRQDDHSPNAGYSSGLSTLLGNRSKRTVHRYSLQEPPRSFGTVSRTTEPWHIVLWRQGSHDLSWTQAARQFRRRDRLRSLRLRRPYAGMPNQASCQRELDQDVRQVRSRSSGRNRDQQSRGIQSSKEGHPQGQKQSRMGDHAERSRLSVPLPTSLVPGELPLSGSAGSRRRSNESETRFGPDDDSETGYGRPWLFWLQSSRSP